MKKTRNLKKAAEIGFALTTLAVLVAGCGGGSSYVAPAGGGAAATGFTGSVVKGPVSTATVYVDPTGASKDCAAVMASLNAISAVTTASGVFNFPAATVPSTGNYLTCATGGTDTVTGANLSGTTLAAPGGATVLTPFTTLVTGQLTASGIDPTKTTGSADANVKAAAQVISVATNIPIASIVPATSTDAQTAETEANVVQKLITNAAQMVSSVATGMTAAQQQQEYIAATRGVALALASQQAAPVNLKQSVPPALVTAAITNTATQASGIAAVASATQAVNVIAQAASATLATQLNNVATATSATLATNVAANDSAITGLIGAITGTFAKQLSSTSAAGIQNSGTTSFNNVVANLAQAFNAQVAFATGAAGSSLATLQASMAAATNAMNTAAASGIIAQALSGVSAASAAQVAATAAASATAALGTTVTANASGVQAVNQISAASLVSNSLQLSLPTVTASSVTASVNTSTAPYSVTVTGQTQSVGMTVKVDGAAILPAGPVPVMLSVTETAGNRKLLLLINQVNVVNNAGVVSVTVPANAKLYALGVNAAGTVITASLNNAAQNVFTNNNGVVTATWAGTALQSALANPAAGGNAGFTNALTAKGTFQVQLAIAGLNSLTQLDQTGKLTAAPNLTFNTANLPPTVAAAANALFPSSTFTGKGTTIVMTAQ